MADNDLLVQSRTFAETRFVSFTIRVRDDVFNDITSTGNVHCGILVWSREAGLPYLRYDCVVNGILDEKEIIKRERMPGNMLYLVSPLFQSQTRCPSSTTAEMTCFNSSVANTSLLL